MSAHVPEARMSPRYPDHVEVPCRECWCYVDLPLPVTTDWHELRAAQAHALAWFRETFPVCVPVPTDERAEIERRRAADMLAPAPQQ